MPRPVVFQALACLSMARILQWPLNGLKAGLLTATACSAGFSLWSTRMEFATVLRPPKGGTTNCNGL